MCTHLSRTGWKPFEQSLAAIFSPPAGVKTPPHTQGLGATLHKVLTTQLSSGSRPFPEVHEAPVEASERGSGQLLHSLPSLALPTRAEGAGGPLKMDPRSRARGPRSPRDLPRRTETDGTAADGPESAPGAPGGPCSQRQCPRGPRPPPPGDAGPFPDRAQPGPSRSRGACWLHPAVPEQGSLAFWVVGVFVFKNTKQRILRKREVVFTRDL